MEIGQIKNTIKVLLGIGIVGREINVLFDDVFLVSYPKSGNTWTRFLVGNLVRQENVTFANIEEIVPDIYQHGLGFFSKVKRPRVLKSHEYFDPRYKKVIYIVRDPRDVAVSYYFHQIKFRDIDETMTIDAYIDDFIAGKSDPFGSWGENVGSWLGARMNNKGFLLVRYEDLLSQPEIELKKIAVSLGIKKTEEELHRAVERSSLKIMKASERETGKKWESLKKTRSDMQFVRSGKSGDWKDCLSKGSVNKIENSWRGLMLELGYL